MADIVPFKKRSKVRPLLKTFSPTAPYEVERIDHDDGSIQYDVIDARRSKTRIKC